MSLANAGVPISMVSTPQFLTSQKVVEKNGWNSDQLTGRIMRYESLTAADLSEDDFIGIAKAFFPEADSITHQTLADYAQESCRWLAAIEAIAKNARFIAMRSGRSAPTTADVRTAMKDSVIPSDAKLQRALESGRASKPGKMQPVAESIMPAPAARSGSEPEPAPADLGTLGSRLIAPGLSTQRRPAVASLIEA